MEFDTALNKVKEAFDVACKKTVEVANVEKQKFDVSSLKSKREKDFSKLGKIFYEMVKSDENASDEIKSIVADITEKTERIDALNAEILSAKNKRVCPECKAGIVSDAVYCSSCGARLVYDSTESEDEDTEFNAEEDV